MYIQNTDMTMHRMTAPCVRLTQMKKTRVKQGDFFDFFMYVHYSTLLHLPPLRFPCDGGCWDRTQDSFRLRHWRSDALATRLHLIHKLHLIQKTSVAYLLRGHQADLPLVNVPQDADALLGEGGHQGVLRHSQQVSLLKQRLRANFFCLGRAYAIAIKKKTDL
jgi:hypothetical protein